MNDPSTIIEHRDALEHLEASGFSRLLEALRDPSCFTERGRVIVKRVAQLMGASPRRVSAMLKDARAALE